MPETPKSDEKKPETAGATSATSEGGHVVVSDQAPDDGAKREQMRNLVEQVLAMKPSNLIMIYEYEGKLGVGAVGTPVELPAVYTAGGDGLAAMLRQSNQLAKAGAG